MFSPGFHYIRGMKDMIIRSLRAAADMLMPRICMTCGKKLLLEEKHICLQCMADLPRTFFWMQPRNPMADRLNERIEDAGLSAYEPYSYAAALFFYRSDSIYRHIPQQIKYDRNLSAGAYFGRMLGRVLSGSEIFKDVDAVIPVPLHWKRKWKRGYNQAETIASAVAQTLDAPLRTDIIRRGRHTKTQTKLGVGEKSANVAGAFETCGGFSDKECIRHILLVDDVFTTGSTVGACFAALRQVFPPEVRISVATLAFAGGD